MMLKSQTAVHSYGISVKCGVQFCLSCVVCSWGYETHQYGNYSIFGFKTDV